MLVLLALLFAVSSALAYQVTSPNADQGWTTSGPNYLKWVRVDTDPLNFTAVLVNLNNTNSLTLSSLVDGTSGSFLCSTPTDGWPAGSFYRVNFDQVEQNGILAQSGDFSISTSSSASSSASTLTTTSATSTTSGASTSVSSSDTSTTPTGTSAATLDADARAGLFTAVAVLTVLASSFF